MSGRLRSTSSCHGSSFHLRAAARSLRPTLGVRSVSAQSGSCNGGMALLPDGVSYPNAKMIGDPDRGMSDAVEKAGTTRSMAAGPRRRWSEADKRRIVAESYQLGASVVLAARRNAVNANLVFNWRRQYRERRGVRAVVVEPDRRQHRFSLHSSLNTAGYSLNLPDVGDARIRMIGLSFALASVQPEAGSE